VFIAGLIVVVTALYPFGQDLGLYFMRVRLPFGFRFLGRFTENKFYALERTANMIKNGERSQDGKKKYFDKPLTTRPLS